jgi:hypothetical protein
LGPAVIWPALSAALALCHQAIAVDVPGVVASPAQTQRKSELEKGEKSSKPGGSFKNPGRQTL